MTTRILFLNGSLRGSTGNTAGLLQRAAAFLPSTARAETLCLAEYTGSIDAIAQRLLEADAFLLGTGVYWGSWGSPLQRFLEVIGSYELSPCFLGKPAGAVVSADSVGGLDVAQRLMGACSLLGCLVPPLSTVVVSRAALSAIELDAAANDDVWHVEDLRVVVQNLVAAHGLRDVPWSLWPVRKLPQLTGPYPTHGVLDAGLAKFT